MTDATAKSLTLREQYLSVIFVSKYLHDALQAHLYLVMNGYDCSFGQKQRRLLCRCTTQEDSMSVSWCKNDNSEKVMKMMTTQPQCSGTYANMPFFVRITAPWSVSMTNTD